MSWLWAGLVIALACTAARAEDVPGSLELSQAGGMSGVTAYQEDRWGLIRSAVTNQGNEARTPLVAHALGEQRHIQFAHRVWVPAQSRRMQVTPVMPLATSQDERSFQMWTWMIDDSTGRERTGPPSEGLLLAARGSFQLGMMIDREDESPADAAAALREAAGHGTGATYLSDREAPALAAAWELLDVLVLARTPDLAPAQVEAMRRWVLSGGHLWVMLDQVDPAFLERLLGDTWNVSVADRVWLDSLSIDDVQTGEAHQIDREAGLDVLRVHAPDMTVTHEVAGYPAVAWQRAGRGKVMVTTVHASAWLEQGVDDEGSEVDVAAPPLAELGWFFEPHREAIASENEHVREAMAGQARTQIGYTIISRTPVFVVLAVFVVALLGGGTLLWRRDRLEWIGVAGVLLAVVTSAALVGMGKLRQSEHVMTLAASDLVEPARDQPYAAARGTFSVFRPDHAPGRVSFAGSGDAVAFPTDARRTSERLRMVWHGLDRWTFPDLSLPAGAARNFTHDRVVELDRPMTATARLTDEGLVGEVHGMDGGTLTDALIAMPNGRLGARVSGDGQFAAGLGDRLTGGQYVHAATLGTLSQTQMNRQATYRRLLGASDFPTEPMLLGWVDAAGAPVELSEEVVRRGQWLLAVPLALEAPAAGERVTVPAPMMAKRPYRNGVPTAGATVYDVQHREWISPISQPTSLFMRYEPPQGLRSIEVDGAVLELNLHAPGWRFEVLRLRAGETESVYEGRNPAGRMRIELDENQAPAMEADGGVIVGLRLEPLPGSDGGSGWSLERMHLNVHGIAR